MAQIVIARYRRVFVLGIVAAAAGVIAAALLLARNDQMQWPASAFAIIGLPLSLVCLFGFARIGWALAFRRGAGIEVEGNDLLTPGDRIPLNAIRRARVESNRRGGEHLELTLIDGACVQLVVGWFEEDASEIAASISGRLHP